MIRRKFLKTLLLLQSGLFLNIFTNNAKVLADDDSDDGSSDDHGGDHDNDHGGGYRENDHGGNHDNDHDGANYQ